MLYYLISPILMYCLQERHVGSSELFIHVVLAVALVHQHDQQSDA